MKRVKAILCLSLCFCMIMTMFPMGNLKASAAETTTECGVMAVSHFSLVSVSKPTAIDQGKGFSLKGKIKSKYDLDYVKIGICNSKGNWIEGKTVKVRNIGKKSFDISTVDSEIKFGDLKPGRAYYYRIYVKDINNHKGNILKRKFHINTNSVFLMKGVSTPESRYKGKSFTIKGKLTSKHKMTTVRVGITDANGKWKSGYYVEKKPNRKTFDLSTVDSQIKFGKLPVGTYYYKVYAHDNNYSYRIFVRKKFYVYATPKISLSSEVTKPSTLPLGKGFDMKGKVSSANDLTMVKIGVCTSSSSWKSGFYETVNASSKEFDINDVNTSIKFGKLKAGTYYYKIYAEDSSGYTKTVLKSQFKVTNPTVKPSGSFSISPDATYPTVQIKGESFVLRGNVTSKNKLSYVKAGVYRSSGKWKSGFYKKVTGIDSYTHYLTSKISPSIKFGNLPTGTYYYKVYAADCYGNTKTVLYKKFKVIKPFTISHKTSSELSSSMKDKMNANGCLAQEWYRGGCTITTAGMMLRRKAIMSGVSSSTYGLITEFNLRANPKCWIYGGGMPYSFTYMGMHVQQYSLNGTYSEKKSKLKSLLKAHPEGVAIYNRNQPHAILLTKYTSLGNFYCCDPVYGKIGYLKNSTLRGNPSQRNIIENLTNYWIITN